ncbi:hypothetical protein BDN72DRAFT_882031 [Pluteus cervinus]|uniref:Uncharacterized protein n=1 Tax=Pluteus cervinus TaxID=181527 RepID=A0ACD3ADR2_9AGAR|nr:hypothetical protein BDN72DRAFT_882031 [Pluteus cervinus]
MRRSLGADDILKQINMIAPELKWTKTHGHFVQMGGFCGEDSKLVLHPRSLIQLLKEKRVEIKSLRITEKQILDRSKGDALSKLLLGLQISWKLPLTEVEVITLAFAALNGVTFLFWWNKPLDVHCPIYIEVLKPQPDAPPPEVPTVRYKVVKRGKKAEPVIKEDGQRVRVTQWVLDHESKVSPFTRIYETVIEPFSSPVEHTMCRKEALEVFIPGGRSRLRLPLFALSKLVDYLRDEYDVDHDNLLVQFFVALFSGLTFVVCPFLYILSRLALVVVSLKALRDPPPDALKTVEWTSYIPHIYPLV